MEDCYAGVFFGDEDGYDYEDGGLDPTEKVKTSNNIVRISYAVLSEAKKAQNAPPTVCRACTAALCKYSTVYPREEYHSKMN